MKYEMKLIVGGGKFFQKLINRGVLLTQGVSRQQVCDVLSSMVKYILRNRLDKIAVTASRLSNNITNKNTQNFNAMAWYPFETTRQENTSS